MIELYGIVPAWGLPDASPFVTKVDCYLRMTGMSYVLVYLGGQNLPNSRIGWSSGDIPLPPKGKFPYLKDGATVIADSSFIIEYLESKYGDRLGESGRTAEERAVALSLRRMLEEHLYWAIVYAHWTEDAIWEEYKSLAFGAFSSDEIEGHRSGVVRDLYGQGIGRHTRSQVYELGNADITALSGYLADKPYVLGERPSALDATAYSFLARILWCPYESPLKEHARSLRNLEAYCQRMQQRYYFALDGDRAR